MKKLFLITGLVLSFFLAQTQNINLLPVSKSNQIITHKYITLSYVEKCEQPDWVFYMVCKTHFASEIERTNKFISDPLVKTKSALPSDYTKSGYDKGHLCPAADMSFNDTAMKECFYMSNMSPQLPGFNRGIWKELETKVREWAKEKDTLYIVTGPILTEFSDTIGTTNKIPVPKYFYKIIFKYNGTNSSAIAFIIPNTSSDKPLSTYVTTIDEVEKQTHIDFFSAIPDEIENTIERQLNQTNWIY